MVDDHESAVFIPAKEVDEAGKPDAVQKERELRLDGDRLQREGLKGLEIARALIQITPFDFRRGALPFYPV